MSQRGSSAQLDVQNFNYQLKTLGKLVVIHSFYSGQVNEYYNKYTDCVQYPRSW